MKIALITSKYPRLNGTFIQREINGLKKAGAKITVFPLYDVDKALFSNKNVLSTFENEQVEWCKIVDCRFLSLRYFSGFLKFLRRFPFDYEILKIISAYYKSGFLDFLKFLYSLPKIFYWEEEIKESSYMLSFWGNYSATVSYILSKNLNIPFSTYLHAGTDLYRKQTYLLQKLILAKRIICVCDFNRKFIKKLYPQHYNKLKNKIIIHHLGLDLKKMVAVPLNENDEKFRVCFVGALEEYKGPMYILEAFKMFIENHKGHIYLCGEGSLKIKLKNYVEKNNLSNHVTFMGNCSNDLVNKTISRCHTLVHASPYIGDAVPTVIKEAMSLSRAVIATDVAGIPELVCNDESGVIIPPQNTFEITKNFEKLHLDRSECKKMGEKGRQIAQLKFNLWENTKLLFNEL